VAAEPSTTKRIPTGYPSEPDAVISTKPSSVVPSRLKCHVCGLHLSGRDELRAAGLPESWEIEDVDPADFDAEKEKVAEEEAELARWYYDLRG
jgi:hypothetical protein